MFEQDLNQKMPPYGQHILGTMAIVAVIGLGGVVLPKKSPAHSGPKTEKSAVERGHTSREDSGRRKEFSQSVSFLTPARAERLARAGRTSPPGEPNGGKDLGNETDLSGYVGRTTADSATRSRGPLDIPKASAGAGRDGNPMARDPNIFASLAKQVMPSVVNLSAVSDEETPPGARRGPHSPRGPWPRPGLPEDFFSPFFDSPHGMREPIPDRDSPYAWNGDGAARGSEARRPNPSPRAVSLGTGVIIEAGAKGGLILTNNHVVPSTGRVLVQFSEDPEEEPTGARVVGRDPDLDIALLKVETPRPLVPAKLGNSESIEVGQYVMAIGNPFGQGHSVTHGIISARGRNAPGLLGRYIQTDAPINPGNSGGPLVNLEGEIVAINNAIDARAQGIGFAIPINLIKEVLPELMDTGHVSRGYLGVNIVDPPSELATFTGGGKSRGPLVAGVQPGGPAYRAGILPEDIITEFNGKKIKRASDLVREVTTMDAGGEATVKVLRNGKEHEFSVSIGERVAQS